MEFSIAGENIGAIMKTHLARSTAGIALAVSAMSAAHAKESETIAALPAIPVAATIAIVEEGTHKTDSPALLINAADEKRLDETFAAIDIAMLEDASKAALSDDVQQAIYDVDFTADGEEGFVNTPVTANGPWLGAAFTRDDATQFTIPQAGTFATSATLGLNQDAQQAIYNVNFMQDARGDLVTANMPLEPTASSGIVNVRSLSANGLTPTYGDIGAFYGDIVAFYGDIVAFYGDINPFYGDISPFYGDISPFYGDISPFYGDIGAFWGDIIAFDTSKLSAVGALGELNGSTFAKLEDNASAIATGGFLGSIYKNTYSGTFATEMYLSEFNASQLSAGNYTARTGGNFNTYLDSIYERHGIDKDNGASFYDLTAAERAAFYLDWNDSTLLYSGVDLVDHWMLAINWTPEITQIQGSGSDTVIGVIDGRFSSDADLGNNIIWSGGGYSSVGGHGAGVASLIAGAHDGFGVMGIAPDVNLATYNPFDSQGDATWTDVADGFVALKNINPALGNVSIVNLSLGESGSIFSNGTAQFLHRWDVDDHYDDTLFVFAAGNEGITQNWDVEFSDADEVGLIFVGSINPLGEISSFSNRPGSGCLTNFGQCSEENKLYRRTVVAPGELLIVSDGAGGVTRASGTSFAAPLVSGAVALLHERWPWLANAPKESAEIIFRSARDLGAPGPDEVYGWGLLDVVASQSPLNFNNVTFYIRSNKNQDYTPVNTQQLLNAGLPASWQNDAVFFFGYEGIGSTFRDFAIPMSTLIENTNTQTKNGQQRMQSFISSRFATWLTSRGTDSNGNSRSDFTQMLSNNVETRGEWTLQYDAIAPNFVQDGAVRPVHNAATLTTPDKAFSFTVGQGQGAMALSGGQFGLMSDHDRETGGVNPLLGLASGEVFAGAGYNIAKGMSLSVGFSETNESWEDLQNVSEVERQRQREVGPREASALTFSIEQNLTDTFSVGAQYTRLNEEDALLGTQTRAESLLGAGATTDALTVTARMSLGNGLSFDLSATGGATKSDDANLFGTSDRVMTSAGQFSVSKVGVMNKRDVLRVSVGQPMTVERGELEFTSEQVIDRQTGERGLVTQSFGIDTKRRVTGELIYATPVTNNAEFGLMARYVSEGEIGQQEDFMVGANVGIRF